MSYGMKKKVSLKGDLNAVLSMKSQIWDKLYKWLDQMVRPHSAPFSWEACEARQIWSKRAIFGPPHPQTVDPKVKTKFIPIRPQN